MLVPSPLNLHHSTDPARRQSEAIGCSVDKSAEPIDPFRTPYSLCARALFKERRAGDLADERRDGHDDACDCSERTEPCNWVGGCACTALPLQAGRMFIDFWTWPTRRDRRRFGEATIWRRSENVVHDHSSSVHTGTALPITADAGSDPKYRPSSESADCQFMTKTSPSAITRHPCQTGSRRPRPSRSRASPTSMPSTAIVKPFLQTVCPGSANTRLSMGTPIGR